MPAEIDPKGEEGVEKYRRAGYAHYFERDDEYILKRARNEHVVQSDVPLRLWLIQLE